MIWDKIQEKSWEIVEKIAIRGRDRLTYCFLSEWLRSPALILDESAFLVHCSQSC